MKNIINIGTILIAIGLVVGLGVLVVFYAKILSPQAKDPTEAYYGLRKMMLEVTPEKISNIETVGTHGVYGVLMEFWLPETDVVITLATLTTGDASLYFSNGAGVLGGGEHEKVREKVMIFNRKADEYISRCEKVDSFPLPERDRTNFYILTKEGVYRVTPLADELSAEGGSFYDLFSSGNDVITEIRIVTEKNI